MRKIACSGIFFLATVGMVNAAEPIGEWRDQDNKATIKIVDCNSRLWGVVASESMPGGLDKNNPDKTKRARSTLGMPVLLNMKKVSDEKDKWEGEVYDAIRGKIFESSIQLKSPNALRVEGCVAFVLCGGQTWTRVDPPGTSGFTYASAVPAGVPKAGAVTPPVPGVHVPPKVATAPPPKAVAPKSATAKPPTTTGAADPAISEVCLLPEIAGAPH